MTSGDGRDEHPLDLAHSISQQAQACAADDGFPRRLMLELENLAGAQGLRTLRLDTRSDLVEARASYAALGYVEMPALDNGQYAEHWFAKDLRATTGQREAPKR